MTTASLPTIQLPPSTRAGDFTTDAPVVKADREISFSFSSTKPVQRFDWEEWEVFDEILSHESSAVRLDRVTSKSCPLLMNHWRDDQVGRVLTVSLEGDRGICTAKISRGARGDQLMLDIEDEIATSASFAYQVYEYRQVSAAEYKQTENGKVKTKNAVMEATDWEILEISIVSIPADPSVGLTKSDAGDRKTVKVRGLTPEPEPTMTTQKQESNQELESLRSQNSALDTDLKITQSQLKIAQVEVEEYKRELNSRDATIAALQKRDAVVSKYNILRRQADGLLSEARISAVEYQELFGEADQDVDRLIKSESGTAELGNLEFYLGKAGKRSPLLNTEIKTKSEPLPTEKESDANVDAKARALLEGISPTTRVAV